MSKFKKTCFICGEKTEKIYSSMCEECFKEKFPPIEELKPLNVKVCNMCKKVNYSNHYMEPEEFEKRFPQIVKKNLIINDKYTLNDLKISNFKINGERVSFQLEVDCTLNNSNS